MNKGFKKILQVWDSNPRSLTGTRFRVWRLNQLGQPESYVIITKFVYLYIALNLQLKILA
jgi:hypothetical protein